MVNMHGAATDEPLVWHSKEVRVCEGKAHDGWHDDRTLDALDRLGLTESEKAAIRYEHALKLFGLAENK